MTAKRRSQRVLDDGKGQRTVTSPRKRVKVSRRVTRRATFEAVLLTTELLKNILQYLPAKDLLLAQRVSKKWRAVVTENDALQKVLFLAPQEPSYRWRYKVSRSAGEYSFSKINARAKLGNDGAYGQVFDCGRLNSLLFQRRNLDVEIDERASQRGETVRFWRLHSIFGHDRRAPSEASYHAMFITQPPVQKANMLLDIEFIGSRYRVQRTRVATHTSRPRGLRIMDLITTARGMEDDYKPKFRYARVVSISLKTRWMLFPTEREKIELLTHDGKFWPLTESFLRSSDG